jgi:hypothetical protein
MEMYRKKQSPGLKVEGAMYTHAHCMAVSLTVPSIFMWILSLSSGADGTIF